MKTNPVMKKTPKKKYDGKVYKKKYNPRFEPKTLTAPERKYFDLGSTLTCPIGSAFVVTPAHLSAPASGTGTNQKIGGKICMKNLKVRANILWPGGQTTNSPSQVRFVIVVDKQANGSVATRSDVFQDGTLFVSPIKIDAAERFIVLADEISDQCTNGQFSVSWECFRKMSIEALYVSAASIPTTSAILMFVAANSDSADATTAHFPVVQFWSRLRFTDQ